MYTGIKLPGTVVFKTETACFAFFFFACTKTQPFTNIVTGLSCQNTQKRFFISSSAEDCLQYLHTLKVKQLLGYSTLIQDLEIHKFYHENFEEKLTYFLSNNMDE